MRVERGIVRQRGRAGGGRATPTFARTLKRAIVNKLRRGEGERRVNWGNGGRALRTERDRALGNRVGCNGGGRDGGGVKGVTTTSRKEYCEC
eukprot:6208679-Pleurochrysis_carterae.AAC.2